jgi:DNA repair exonuclease SbcCD ATPase subunit
MATLPQERGSAPDFLFLDEPIGAFDQTRKESLMELLTRGEIAENFSQIFVISHIDDLKKEFDQHIKMEDGRIEQKKLEA